MNRQALPHSPRHGEVFEVDIDGLSPEGLGTAAVYCTVGPQEEPKDYTFTVRKAVPGDRACVEVETRRRRTVVAHIDHLLEPSPMRTTPRCRHFGRRDAPGKGCGGCTLQSMSYRHQLANKERTVKKLMQSRGIDPGHVLPIEGMRDPWYYRNTMEYSFGDTANREFSLGMYPTGYHFEVLNLDECCLESEFVSTFLPRLRQWAIEHGLAPYINRDGSGFLRTVTIREGKRTGQRMVELTTTDDDPVLFGRHADADVEPAAHIAGEFCGFVAATAARMDADISSIYWTVRHNEQGQPTRFDEHHLYGRRQLSETMHLPGGRVLTFDIHPRTFFQPNTLQAEKLYAEVIAQSGLGERPGDRRSRPARVLDLYCGAGAIGLCLAPYAGRVIGIERSTDAVVNARQNAARNGIDNIEFYTGAVGDVLDDIDAWPADLVVVDPPRSGLKPEALAQLEQIGASRIVYVSCNPRALADDLVQLQQVGYELRAIQPVDMFAHTYHIENVAVLAKPTAGNRQTITPGHTR